MTRYAFDCETDGLLDTLTVIHSLVLTDLDTGITYSCHDRPTWKNPGEADGILLTRSIEWGVKALMEASFITGHNVLKFDVPALAKVFPWFRPKGRVFDTLIASRLIWTAIADWDAKLVRKGVRLKAENPTAIVFPGRMVGSHTLEAWGLRLGEWKGDYAKQMEAEGLDPWASWNSEMQTYCEQDVVVTVKLLERIEAQRYAPQSLQLEHDFAAIMAQQERHGFCFDEEGAAALYAKLIKRRHAISAQLQDAFPPEMIEEVFVPKSSNRKMGYEKGIPFVKRRTVSFNPSSRQMIAARLIAKGWKPEEFTPSGQPKIDETILSKLPFPEAKLLADHFLVEKRIGQLAEGDQAWLRLVRNGRIHGSVNTNGAVTGRCTHSRPNVAQVPSVGALYGAECRALFMATPGLVQVGADASGLELRCLAHFMAMFDDGAYGRILLEGDIHWANVLALGLVPDGTERDEDRFPLHKLLRGGAKTFIYGFLYGAGDVKVGAIILDIALREVQLGLGDSVFDRYFKGNRAPTEDDLKRVGKRLKKTFLDKTPAIRLLRDKVKAAASRGYLIGLDGRKLHIRSDHAALNTLLQSAGALIVKMATVIAYQKLSSLGYVFGRDYAFVAHVHDEMQLEVKPQLKDIVGEVLVQSMQESGRHFNFKCPIDGEYKSGRNWKDCH